MSKINIIFPHQLFKKSPLIKNGFPCYLVEEYLFFKQYAFHKQKIAFHRASMKAYAAHLESKQLEVHYINAQDKTSDIRQLIPFLQKQKIKKIHYIDPTDNYLSRRLKEGAAKAGIELEEHVNTLFLNTKEELSDFFRKDKKKFFQTSFYIEQRKKRKILVDENEEALGGKWSFDAENRKKFPAKQSPPAIVFPKANDFYAEAKKYVAKNYANNPGELTDEPLYPTDFKSANSWLNHFFQQRFHRFGDYEDAIVKEEIFLHHSVLTPMLNTGLLLPGEIVDAALTYALEHEVPINSTEGFVRQIIGWREFIRGVYEVKGSEERTKNYWGFTRKIPASFYDGTTGIEPIDVTIKKVLKTGYCHHIERLMILGNFMVLCEFDPDEVYRWFMELFIDAYDWVMVPNVYGMSQFADGGLLSTKPYISGSNYVMKMSNYKKGDWQETWDALFWRFMNVNREFFLKNPRIGMLVRTFDKMSEEKQDGFMEKGDAFLKSI